MYKWIGELINYCRKEENNNSKKIGYIEMSNYKFRKLTLYMMIFIIIFITIMLLTIISTNTFYTDLKTPIELLIFLFFCILSIHIFYYTRII